jgi:hypothetical protein
MARTTSWPEFWQMLSFMKRGKEEEDPLERAGKVASYGSTLLDIQKKQRDLAGPSPREKYGESQRSAMVGSALEMFGSLYKTASPSSRKILGEQMTSLWGLMDEGDRTKYKMLVSHTPINPRVQKAMWFEETNPRPRMPIVREGDGTWTNVPPRSEEYRRAWAEFDVASDEWNTLREMAVEGKSASEANWKSLPKQYQTENPKVTAYRDPLDKRIKYFDWGAADQAEILNAVEKGWATQADMMTSGVVPLSTPREYIDSGRPVTVKQVREVVSGDVKLDYEAAGPLEGRKEAPKSLTDAVALIDSGVSLEKIKAKSPAIIDYYLQMKGIIGTSGKERLGLQMELQQSIIRKYPSEERYIPFLPTGNLEGKWFRFKKALTYLPIAGYFMPTPSAGKTGNVVLVQADRLVEFYDKNEKPNRFWWSDINKVAYDVDGIPIRETFGKVPGDQLDVTWE